MVKRGKSLLLEGSTDSFGLIYRKIRVSDRNWRVFKGSWRGKNCLIGLSFSILLLNCLVLGEFRAFFGLGAQSGKLCVAYISR